MAWHCVRGPLGLVPLSYLHCCCDSTCPTPSFQSPPPAAELFCPKATVWVWLLHGHTQTPPPSEPNPGLS